MTRKPIPLGIEEQRKRKMQKAAALIVLQDFGLSGLEERQREFVSCVRDIEVYIREISVHGIRRNSYTTVPVSIIKLIVKALNSYGRNFRILQSIKSWSQYDISEEQA